MAEYFTVLEDDRSVKSEARGVLTLALEMTKAELKSRQFQRLLGPAWWILEPSLMSLVYFFMSTRLNFSTGNNHFFFIFVSTTVWRFFSNCLSSSLVAYVAYGSVIRQTAFPLISVNLTNLFTEFVFFMSGFLVMMSLGAISGLEYGWPLLGLFPLLFTQLVITLAVMIFLSCVGVYFRDLMSIMALILQGIFLLSPSIYGIERVPYAEYIQYINPFFYLFPAYREIILHNNWPDFKLCSIWFAIGCISLFFALRTYERLRPNFLRVL